MIFRNSDFLFGDGGGVGVVVKGAIHQNLTIFSVIFSLKIVLLVGRTYDTSRSLGKGDSDWWDK